MNSYICIYKSIGIKDLQQIKAYLDQIATISKSDWDFFTSKLHRRVIQKKTIFLKLKEM